MTNSSKPKTTNSTVITIRDEGKVKGHIEIIGDTVHVWAKHKGLKPNRTLKLKTLVKELLEDYIDE